jgi:hypothetical protein
MDAGPGPWVAAAVRPSRRDPPRAKLGNGDTLVATRKQKQRAVAAGTPLNTSAKAAKKTSKVKKSSRGK